MAFVYKTSNNGGASPATFPYTKTTETVFNKGDLLVWDVANNALERATSSSTNITAEAIAYDSATAGDTECVAVPLASGQFWEVDTNVVTAAGQVGQRAALTDHDTLDNTGSDVNTTAAFLRIVRVIGATSAKKALVKVMGVPGMVTT